MTEQESIVARIDDAFREVNRNFYEGTRKAFFGIVGSQSHGTYVPKDDPDSIDDVDIMGIIPLPMSCLFGLDTFEHWTYKQDELDVVVYSLPKFAHLLLKGNPNVLGLLWLRPEEHLQVPKWWNWLCSERRLFITKEAYHPFAGYASNQLSKMTSYTPDIDAELQQLEFDLLAVGITPTMVMDKKAVARTPEIQIKIERLRHLRTKFHAAYMGEKRRKLVRKHGYDTKNAAHLIRLLKMCTEFLYSGDVNVYREHDAEMLKSIKRGEWELEAVKAHAEELFKDCKLAYSLSTLPDKPDYVAINSLIIDIAQSNQ